jgi:hypothetical protein
MNIAELHRRLISAAKANPPGDRVPYTFEKRIMARLMACPALDGWGLWARALWRATVPCVAVTLLLSAWSFFAPVSPAFSSDLSQEIENTVLAAVEQDQSNDSTW